MGWLDRRRRQIIPSRSACSHDTVIAFSPQGEFFVTSSLDRIIVGDVQVSVLPKPMRYSTYGMAGAAQIIQSLSILMIWWLVSRLRVYL